MLDKAESAKDEDVKSKAEGVAGELPEGEDAKSKVEGELPEGEDAKSKVEGAEGELPEGEEAKDKVEGAEGELPEGEEAKDKVEGAEGELPEGEVPGEVPDLSILKGKKVNKLGKIVDDEGTPFGVLVEGDPKKLIGKKVDDKGCIWDDSGMWIPILSLAPKTNFLPGNVIGKAELLPEKEREAEPSAPFEDFPDAVLDKSGNVMFEGRIVGKLIEGEAKKLEGKKVYTH